MFACQKINRYGRKGCFDILLKKSPTSNRRNLFLMKNRLIKGNFRHIHREKIIVQMCVIETVPKKNVASER